MGTTQSHQPCISCIGLAPASLKDISKADILRAFEYQLQSQDALACSGADPNFLFPTTLPKVVSKTPAAHHDSTETASTTHFTENRVTEKANHDKRESDKLEAAFRMQGLVI